MNISVSHETEARLADEARRRGISINALLEGFINECGVLTHSVQARPELPVWSLGSVGALHRRNIYNDAR